MRFLHNFYIALTFSLFFLSFSWGAPVAVSSDETDLTTRGSDLQPDYVSDLVTRAHPHQFQKAVLQGQANRKNRKDVKKAANVGKSQTQIRAGQRAGKDARRAAHSAGIKSAAARASTRADKTQRRNIRKATLQPSPANKKKNEKNQMKADWNKLAKGQTRPARVTKKNPKLGPGGSFPTKKPVVRTSTKPRRVRSAAGKTKARKNYGKNAKAKKNARPKLVQPKKQQISQQIKGAAKYMQSTVDIPGRKQKFEYKRTGPSGDKTHVTQTGKDVRKAVMNGQLFAKQGVPGDPGTFDNRPYGNTHPLHPATPLGPSAKGGREYPVTSGHFGWQKADSQNRGVVRAITSESKVGGKTVPKFEGLVTHDSTYGVWGEHYQVPKVP